MCAAAPPPPEGTHPGDPTQGTHPPSEGTHPGDPTQGTHPPSEGTHPGDPSAVRGNPPREPNPGDPSAVRGNPPRGPTQGTILGPFWCHKATDTVCFGSIIVVWIVVPLEVSLVLGSKCMYYEWFLYDFVENVRI